MILPILQAETQYWLGDLGIGEKNRTRIPATFAKWQTACDM